MTTAVPHRSMVVVDVIGVFRVMSASEHSCFVMTYDDLSAQI